MDGNFSGEDTMKKTTMILTGMAGYDVQVERLNDDLVLSFTEKSDDVSTDDVDALAVAAETLSC